VSEGLQSGALDDAERSFTECCGKSFFRLLDQHFFSIMSTAMTMGEVVIFKKPVMRPFQYGTGSTP
jgi:hypothetical protein